MNKPISTFLRCGAIALAALLLPLTGCNLKCSTDTGDLQAADDQLKEDLAMYVSVWDRIVNERKLDLINGEHFTDDITLVAATGNIVGIPDFKEYYSTFVSGFSEIEFTVVDAFGQGDKIVKHWTFKGTHTGDFFGIPPTGKRVSVDGVTLVLMRDGKIAQEQDFFDNLEFMQQLGIIPRE